MLEKWKSFENKGWKIAVILMPLVLWLIVTLVYVVKLQLPPIPKLQWNDEACYYSLVKSWLEGGQPYGFWGYNGAHALLGTNGPWGVPVILPYALFGFMFGWNASSLVYANITFLCLANLLFLFLTKPEGKVLKRLVLIQVVSGVSILYLTTGMSEPLRFSMAIVLAGILYKLLFLESGKAFRYFIAPLVILLFMQMYIFLGFVIPIYVWAILPEESLPKRIITGLVTMVLVTGASYGLLHFTSCTYSIGKMDNILTALRSGVLEGIMTFLRYLLDSIKGLWGVLVQFKENYGLFTWFVACYFILLLVSLAFLVRKFVKKKITDKSYVKGLELEEWQDIVIYAVIFYSLAIYLFMFISIYTVVAFSLMRGLSTVLLFCLYLLVFTHSRWEGHICIAVFALGMIPSLCNMDYYMEERFFLPQEAKAYAELEDTFAEYIVLDEERGAWYNTVVVYTTEPKVIYALPAGAGVNMMMKEGVPENAGYLVFSKADREELRSDWLEFYYQDIYKKYGRVLEDNFELIYNGSDYMIYKSVLYERMPYDMESSE